MARTTPHAARAGRGPNLGDWSEALEDLGAADLVDLDRLVAQDFGETWGVGLQAAENCHGERP